MLLKRMILLVTVTALMVAAMVAANAAPGFAQEEFCEDWCGGDPSEPGLGESGMVFGLLHRDAGSEDDDLISPLAPVTYSCVGFDTVIGRRFELRHLTKAQADRIQQNYGDDVVCAPE